MSDSKMYRPVVPRRKSRRDIRGVNYCIHEWGQAGAPLLVYLHGWGDSGATLQFVVDSLQSDWHVVAPDWRGFGRSTIECESYWFPDYLADLHELLSRFSPDEPIRLVGHSMGANVASLYAGSVPERVQALINIEGFGLPDSDPRDAPRRYRLWLAAPDPSFSTYDDLDALAVRIRDRSPRMSVGQALYVADQWAVRGVDGRFRLRADPRHRLPNPVLYRRAEAEACWRAIRAGCLLVTGAESDLAAEFGAVFEAMYPGADSVCIDAAGHMPHFEAPDALASTIEHFLSQLNCNASCEETK